MILIGGCAGGDAARVLLVDPVEDVRQRHDGGRLHVVEQHDGAAVQRGEVRARRTASIFGAFLQAPVLRVDVPADRLDAEAGEHGGERLAVGAVGRAEEIGPLADGLFDELGVALDLLRTPA